MIEECLRVVREVPARQDRLLRTAERIAPAQRRPLLDAAEELQQIIRAAAKRLERFRVVPQDADADCRCSDATARVIPAFLANQAQEILLPSS